MVKVAFIDWDDTLVNWNDALRRQVIGEILQGSTYISQDMLYRVQTDFLAIVAEARGFAEQEGLNPKSATILFDYLFWTVPEPKRTQLIAEAKTDYRNKAATKLSLFPDVLEQLQQLQDQGYLLVVISNKAEESMQIEYQAVVKNYPQLAALIPNKWVFATSDQANEKPNDFLHRQALVMLHDAGKVSFDRTGLELLIIGDSPTRDAKAASNFYNTLFGGQTYFIYRDQPYPTPDPYSCHVRFALFDPKKKHGQDLLTPLKIQGLDAFTLDSWKMLGSFLAGDKKSKPECKHPHSANEIATLATEYLSDRAPGYYMLRTRPRCWARVAADNSVIIGKEAIPQTNGSFDITFVDVEPTLERDRDRFYQQNLFVKAGKVFNAAAYVCFKDFQGADHILFIKDKRNWNVPIGRVDGDELTKAENQAFLSAVRGKSPEKAHCLLAALRELHEETGVNLTQFIADKRVRILPCSSDDISGNSLSDEENYATTVTMQIMIDLGFLTAEEILELQRQLKPQAAEHIQQAEIIPVNQIVKENTSSSQQVFFWQKPGIEAKQQIFSHVGRIITTLRTQKQVPFDHLTQLKVVLNSDASTIGKIGLLTASAVASSHQEPALNENNMPDVLKPR